MWCGTTENIHAAHVKPTKLSKSKPGRGLGRRFKDVVNNPDCYRPMCGKHHRLFDSLVSMQAKIIEEPIPF